MANNSKHVFLALLACATTLVVTSCSTTKGVPEGDQLYTGLKKIKYEKLFSGHLELYGAIDLTEDLDVLMKEINEYLTEWLKFTTKSL